MGVEDLTRMKTPTIIFAVSIVLALLIMPVVVYGMTRGLLIESFDVPRTGATIAAVGVVLIVEASYVLGALMYAKAYVDSR